MKNIDRLAKYITKNGSKSFMIHTIYGTNNWLICQKIESNKWFITLGNPLGNVTYNLGTVTNEQHMILWEQLTRREVDKRMTQAMLAKKFKEEISNFKKNFLNIYRKFINTQNVKTKITKRKTRRNGRNDNT